MQARKHQITAVFFDLGETLVSFGRVDTSRLFRDGAKLSYSYLKKLGQPVGDFKRYCRRNLGAIRTRYWLSKIIGRDFDSLELLKQIGTRAGYRLGQRQWEELSWLWYEPLSRCGKAEPDIGRTLGKLREMGLKLGLLSNTFIHASSLNRHLQQLGISDFFAVKLFSYQFRFRKPSRQIFKVAAETIAEPPERIMYVGDRINKDIRPAVRLGMVGVLKEAYTNRGRRPPAGVWRIKNLAELPELVTMLNTQGAGNR